ncbi:hemagglutinin repeat-containing protein [Yersinia kristensenii]|uniref:hemagglutinin repeat-containing protein n=1 Tax=Yersinia kristensenii TaxID=28152 RepID=UPI001C60BEFE|nr:hemagglutinin repeat-containing protein [Yersinia kristensenii]MBW5812873.1 hemagglutinin repeat-containing protein [Yersinia kristensenii]MBW5830174.1 hemagglutinin repeat-containing protein [Yersinia kristensenii]
MRENKFKLSPAGKFAALLSLMLTPAVTVYAAGIEAAGDGTHRPEISSTINDVPLINIATPSVAGVSHNQYQEFNVDQRGVVFNNSKFKVFEGMISARANPNLTGNPARVILNEVVGSNTSTLNGHQQIIGMSADYILVNANGVICDGCSFAPEFKNVTLAVGAAVIDNGEVTRIETTGNSKMLSLANTDKNTHIADVLTLIAPVIDVDGDVRVKDKLSFIVGQNNVEINTGQLLKSNSSDSSVKTIDGYYLGSMAANRINIIDTRKDNNVNLFSNVSGQELINVEAKGDVRLRSIGKKGQRLSDAETITLLGNNIDITRTLTADERERFNIHSDNYTDNTNISGGNVDFFAYNNIDLAAISIHNSDNLFMSANRINIDGHMTESSEITADYEPEKQFFGVAGTKYLAKLEREIAFYSAIKSQGNIKLKGREGITLKGVRIDSNRDITLFSQGDIHLNGMTGTDKEKSEIKYTHWGNDAKTGHDNFETVKEVFKPLYIKSKEGVNIESEKAVYVHGAKIKANEKLSVKGDNGVYIGVANMLHSRVDKKEYTQHFGIAGSEKDNKTGHYYVVNKSELTGNKVNISSRKDVEILASKISSLQDLGLYADGNLTIDGVLNRSGFKQDQKTGVIFDITGSSITANNQYEKFIDTELTSGGNTSLHSHKNIYIDGSQINANKYLTILADGDITVQAARQQQKIDEERTRLNMAWFAKQQGDKQYRAGFLLKHRKDSENSDKNEHKTATLSGQLITMDGGRNITFFGTDITTTDGDFRVTAGKNVGFFTARNRSIINKNRTENSAGFYYTGGIDKMGSGVQYTHVDDESHNDIVNNLVVKTKINGNLDITAGGDINQQGVQHDVAKNYSTRAVNINNMASHNVDILNKNKSQVDAGFGFNIDYSGYTRKIEKAIKNPADSLNIIGGVGSQKGITDPNAGMDITASGSNTKSTAHNSLAQVTTIKAQNINIEATKDVLDEGTQYHATGGAMKLNAQRHFNNAAVNIEKGTSQQEKGEANVRLSTTTGHDIKVGLSAKAETSQGDKYTEGLLPTYIQASNGVNITATGDAYYYATQIDGGEGSVNIKAGNNLYFDQISDIRRIYKTVTSGYGKLALAKSAGSKDFRLEGGGGHQKNRSNSADVGVSKIKTRSEVNLKAGANLTTKGMQIGSQAAPVNNVILLANGKAKLLAAVSDSADVNDAAFGDFRLGGKRADSSTSTSGSGFIGGRGKVDKVNQSISNQQGGIIFSNNTVSIQSGSDSNQAIHMQGLQINATEVDVKTLHGGVFMESALSELPKENWGFGADMDLVLSRTTGKNDNDTVDGNNIDKKHYAGAGVKVTVDIQDRVQHDNTRIKAQQFSLLTKKDAVMKGARVEAIKANLDIGGDLNIESVKSREDSIKVDVDIALSHTNDKGSSVVSSLSKLGTKRFEKGIKDSLNSGLKKTEVMYNKVSPQKDAMGGGFNKEGASVELPKLSTETKSRNLADKTARYMGREFKGMVADPAGLQGHLKLDVKVVNDDAVTEQSGIFGKEEVVVTVHGATKLHGAEISNMYQDVTLNINALQLSSINNSYHNGGGAFNLSASALGNIIGVTQDGVGGKSPFINQIPYASTRNNILEGQIVGPVLMLPAEAQ